MVELTDERQQTIGRDLRAVATFIEAAKDGLDRKKKEQRAVWDLLDLAEARLQALSLYLGLISDDGKETQ
jgi:hypothetical protein